MNMNMKYALILFVGLSMAASGAFAQERPARDRLEEIEQLTVTPFRHHKPAGEFDKVGINFVPEIGIGTSIVSTDDFKSRGSGVLYAHLLEAYVRPVSWVSLHVGGGIGWRKYQSKENVFSLNTDDKITIGTMPEEWAASGKSRSSIWGPTLLIPATLQFHFGDASIHLGAEALYSYRTRVRTNFRDERTHCVTDTKYAAIVPWSYDFFASISYDGLGLFVKYQPATARQFPEPGPTLSCWTLGIRMGM